jgi:hypothetical protein
MQVGIGLRASKHYFVHPGFNPNRQQDFCQNNNAKGMSRSRALRNGPSGTSVRRTPAPGVEVAEAALPVDDVCGCWALDVVDE